MNDIAKKLMEGGCKPRTKDIVKTLAKEINCEEAIISAVISVESSGKGFDTRGRVKVLFEKHKFYKHLPEKKRKAAVKAGLARQKWISPKNGGYTDQKTNFQALKLLCAAIAIDEDAALKSASYGAGQVLGERFGAAGWRNVQDFVLSMCESEDSQIQAMFGYIKSFGLAPSLRDKDFDAVARIYNGPGQVKTYGTKMRNAYAKEAGKKAVINSPVRASGLRLGSKGYRVQALQNRLTQLGYAVVVDSDYGPATRRAVIAFQADYDLETDGVVGPKTQDALDVATLVVEPDREDASMKDLRKQGADIVKQSDKNQIAGGLVIAGAAIKGVDETGILDTVKNTLSQVGDLKETVVEPLSSFASFAANNWWIIALLVGLLLIYASQRIKRDYLKDHRSGKAL